MCRISNSTNINIKHTSHHQCQKTLILAKHSQSIARIYAANTIQNWWRKNKITKTINIRPSSSWQKQEQTRCHIKFPKLFPIKPSKYTIQGQIQRAYIRRNKRIKNISKSSPLKTTFH